jgi:hypothetical protein
VPARRALARIEWMASSMPATLSGVSGGGKRTLWCGYDTRAGSGPRIALMHRPQIVLGVLVIILRSNRVTISDFRLRQREIAIIVSPCILWRLGVAGF